MNSQRANNDRTENNRAYNNHTDNDDTDNNDVNISSDHSAANFDDPVTPVAPTGPIAEALVRDRIKNTIPMSRSTRQGNRRQGSKQQKNIPNSTQKASQKTQETTQEDRQENQSSAESSTSPSHFAVSQQQLKWTKRAFPPHLRVSTVLLCLLWVILFLLYLTVNNQPEEKKTQSKSAPTLVSMFYAVPSVNITALEEQYIWTL